MDFNDVMAIELSVQRSQVNDEYYTTSLSIRFILLRSKINESRINTIHL